MIKAGCKINLGLKVIGKRKDGYHEISTIFYPLEMPSDHLIFEKVGGSGIQIECENADIPLKQNILSKAWQNFSSLCKSEFGVKITLFKRIPMGAGLGGGSSDAAAFLLWLNQNHSIALNREQLNKIAFATGADVPFFLDPLPSIAEGAGEKLYKIKFSGNGLYLVLVVPNFISNTAWVFNKYDEIYCNHNEKQNKLTSPEELCNKFALSTLVESSIGVLDTFQNDLEKVVFEKFPALLQIKTKLYEYGAVVASMSGSGSTIFGIFNNKDKAKKAHKIFQKDFANVYFMPMRNY